MQETLKKHAEKIRYIIVGGGNTILDFALLFIFVTLGVDRIVANYISTGFSMVVSFFLNKSFTFKDTSANARRQFVFFLVITLFGLWVIQPIVIIVVTQALEGLITNENILLLIAKLIATIASLIWNYLLYSRFVFKKSTS